MTREEWQTYLDEIIKEGERLLAWSDEVEATDKELRCKMLEFSHKIIIDVKQMREGHKK